MKTPEPPVTPTPLNPAGLGADSGDALKIGLLHSWSGTMALSEKPLLDAEQMAIDEINRAGGVLGRRLEPLVADGASQPERFAQAARELLAAGANALFGCWTSASRKAVRPVVEAADSLLWYPVQYEGLEESSCICYSGSCLNQQIIPAVEWTLEQFGRRVFLIGSDYVFPRTANQLIRSLVAGRGGLVVAERYFDLGAQDFREVIAEIGRTRPAAVINTLNGDSNLGFYQQYRAAGLLPAQTPIIATSVAETELQSVATLAAGHLACWSYFQSLDTPENRAFVRRFKERHGEKRVVSAPAVTAYIQLYLWKQAVERAGAFAPPEVRRCLPGCVLISPMGELRMEANQHLSLPLRIGRLNEAGQFDIVWQKDELVAPLPWLGVEKMDFPGKEMVCQSLAAFADNINYTWRLEHEIAERKALAAALEQVKADLEVTVKERTRQLEKSIADLNKEVASHQESEELLRRSRLAALNMMEDAIEARSETQQLNAELEERVRHRTADLEAANKDLEAFSYSVSHDLRAPLRAIAGFARILVEEHGPHLPATAQRYLDIIQSNTLHMGHLVDDLLALSRLGRQEMATETLEPAQLVRQALELLRGEQEGRNVKITLGDLPSCQGDATLLRQVFVNLLSNALKFTAKRDPAVIEVGFMERCGDGVPASPQDSKPPLPQQASGPVFFVRDNGVGFDTRYAHKLFGVFQRLHRVEDYAGTGIGLAIVQRIIQRHGGRVWAESELDKGATFYFTLKES